MTPETLTNSPECRQMFLRGLCVSQLVAGVLLHLTAAWCKAQHNSDTDILLLILISLLLPILVGAIAAWVWEPLHLFGMGAGLSALLLTGAGAAMAYLLFGGGGVYLYRLSPVLFLLTLAGIEQGRNFAQSRRRLQP